MEHLDPDQLVLLALGERTATGGGAAETPLGAPHDSDESVRAHLQECAACRNELSELARTVELAREAGELGPQTPVILPASIWSGIAQELGIGNAADLALDTPTEVADRKLAPAAERVPAVGGLPDRVDDDVRHAVEPADRSVGDRRRTSSHRVAGRRVTAVRVSARRGLLAAAAVVAIGLGVGVGVVIGRGDDPAAAIVQSQAALVAMPAAPPTAHGTATVTQTADGLILKVTARALPLRQGYYEVWLYNPTADQMVAVGTLGAGGDGIWSLASTIDLRSYSIVDVSAQDFDGNPAHKDSVLQGPLTQ